MGLSKTGRSFSVRIMVGSSHCSICSGEIVGLGVGEEEGAGDVVGANEGMLECVGDHDGEPDGDDERESDGEDEGDC